MGHAAYSRGQALGSTQDLRVRGFGIHASASDWAPCSRPDAPCRPAGTCGGGAPPEGMMPTTRTARNVNSLDVTPLPETRVATSQVTSASIYEAGGFPACSRWSRSEATTPPGTRANVKPRIPAGMPAPGAGLGWHPSRVRRGVGIGDRWYRFAQPPATCCETFGFERGIPCGPSFRGAQASFPCMGMPGLFGEGERMGSLRSIRWPLHPRPWPEP